MKRYFAIFAALMLCLGSACTSTNEVKIDVLEHTNDLNHSDFSLSIDFPIGGEGALGEIRNTVMDMVDDELGHMLSFDGDRAFPAYEGDADDADAWFSYYYTAGKEYLDRKVAEDVSEREAEILSSGDYTPEEKQDLLESMPRWEYEYQLVKVRETKRFVVFHSMAFVYMGGAHGGITGIGPLTLDKRDGTLLTDWFLPDAKERMQDLLVAGLQEYFASEEDEMTREELLESLFIEDGVIPLPQWSPLPMEDGLNLIYQQYEIAAYAMGMPVVTIPYKDAAPFLTPKARKLLNI